MEGEAGRPPASCCQGAPALGPQTKENGKNPQHGVNSGRQERDRPWEPPRCLSTPRTQNLTFASPGSLIIL